MLCTNRVYTKIFRGSCNVQTGLDPGEPYDSRESVLRSIARHELPGWSRGRDLIPRGFISLIYKLKILTLSPSETQLVNSLFTAPFSPQRDSPPHPTSMSLFLFSLRVTFQILAPKSKARRGLGSTSESPAALFLRSAGGT